jgi:hypothetical protein
MVASQSADEAHSKRELRFNTDLHSIGIDN